MNAHLNGYNLNLNILIFAEQCWFRVSGMQMSSKSELGMDLFNFLSKT